MCPSVSVCLSVYVFCLLASGVKWPQTSQVSCVLLAFEMMFLASSCYELSAVVFGRRWDLTLIVGFSSTVFTPPLPCTLTLISYISLLRAS